ncbi:MAG: aminotransferase class I/II-fold pyridoxal phosphate-dependent enzyme, partial [Acidobacteria bacterium]|nr:aminotransferase class I/II-fold pyridoxal phosphate-dependent enzyme [Acidobacteriota bacterium]
GEDPTINQLEERAAQVFGREAALFVPTGTMGNQIALKAHTHHGQEIICEQRAHIYEFELSMMAAFSGCMPRAIAGENGVLTWAQVKRHIRPKIYYVSQTGLVSLENTHNMAGGTVFPPEIADEVCDGAHEAGIPVHLDGARIFNTAVALGRRVADITSKFDSVMFCLSKGLGAPVGSLLVGSQEFIDRARVIRKMLGGGMRQAGILAAAGLIALERMPARLHEDHDNAKFIARRLQQVRGIKLEPATVMTNIVVFNVSGTGMTSAEISRKLAERNVLINGIDSETMRLVTHMDVDRAACERALEALTGVCGRA